MNAKKKALGRGLSALLEDTGKEAGVEKTSLNQAGHIAEIPLERIQANPFQPRDHFEEESLRELADSIARQGMIQPVTVRKSGRNAYQLISGERRVKAALIAGLTTIPAYIREADDEQMLELALVENIQRENLNAIEIAISYHRLMEECSLTQEALATRVGKKRATIANYVRLLRLPAEIQIAIRDEHISMGHARALVNIEDEQTQLTILRNILAKDLSVREVETIVRNLNKEEEVKTKTPQSLPKAFKELRDELSRSLGNKVVIRRSPNGKGSITLAFNSDQDLVHLVEKLRQ